MIQLIARFMVMVTRLILSRMRRYEISIKEPFTKLTGLFSENLVMLFKSSRPEMFLTKGVLRICSKFTGEHPCQSVTSIKLHFGMGVLL